MGKRWESFCVTLSLKEYILKSCAMNAAIPWNEIREKVFVLYENWEGVWVGGGGTEQMMIRSPKRKLSKIDWFDGTKIVLRHLTTLNYFSHYLFIHIMNINVFECFPFFFIYRRSIFLFKLLIDYRFFFIRSNHAL